MLNNGTTCVKVLVQEDGSQSRAVLRCIKWCRADRPSPSHSIRRMEKIIADTRARLNKIVEGNLEVLELFNILAVEFSRTENASVYKPWFDAIIDAATFHAGQFRKSGNNVPYIIHPLDVAWKLWSIGRVRDVDTLIAAVLHDAVEDTEMNLEFIAEHYGEHVAFVVSQVTDDKDLPREEQMRQQIELAPQKCEEARLVKLGDKLSNCSSLLTTPPPQWSADKIDSYWKFCEEVVHALGPTNSLLEQELLNVFHGLRTMAEAKAT